MPPRKSKKAKRSVSFALPPTGSGHSSAVSGPAGGVSATAQTKHLLMARIVKQDAMIAALQSDVSKLVAALAALTPVLAPGNVGGVVPAATTVAAVPAPPAMPVVAAPSLFLPGTTNAGPGTPGKGSAMFPNPDAHPKYCHCKDCPVIPIPAPRAPVVHLGTSESRLDFVELCEVLEGIRSIKPYAGGNQHFIDNSSVLPSCSTYDDVPDNPYIGVGLDGTRERACPLMVHSVKRVRRPKPGFDTRVKVKYATFGHYQRLLEGKKKREAEEQVSAIKEKEFLKNQIPTYAAPRPTELRYSPDILTTVRENVHYVPTSRGGNAKNRVHIGDECMEKRLETQTTHRVATAVKCKSTQNLVNCLPREGTSKMPVFTFEPFSFEFKKDLKIMKPASYPLVGCKDVQVGDRMLVDELRWEASFRVRTPKLYETLKHKADRVMADFDVSNYTQAQLTDIKASSVIIAMHGTKEDHARARIMGSKAMSGAWDHLNIGLR